MATVHCMCSVHMHIHVDVENQHGILVTVTSPRVYIIIITIHGQAKTDILALNFCTPASCTCGTYHSNIFIGITGY